MFNSDVFPVESFLSSDLLTILVGPEKVKYIVHQDLICDRIPYFLACLDSKLKESREGIVEFHDVDPDAFGVVLRWVYSGDIRRSATEEMSLQSFMFLLVHAYILGNRFCAEALQNKVIDVFKMIFDWGSPIPIDLLKLLRDNELTDCKLRDMLLQMLAAQNTAQFDGDDGLGDILCEGRNPPLAALLNAGGPDAIGFLEKVSFECYDFLLSEDKLRCNFHDHKTTEICSKPPKDFAKPRGRRH